MALASLSLEFARLEVKIQIKNSLILPPMRLDQQQMESICIHHHHHIVQKPNSDPLNHQQDLSLCLAVLKLTDSDITITTVLNYSVNTLNGICCRSLIHSQSTYQLNFENLSTMDVEIL
ncbi:hypothetical protein BJV82DRAFT_580289 [Fennellomyces sp. T-0311]|nr:hypothetical protein BJV82DRAFT_580289 [Fennellomyces sp. T-0311]